MAAAAQLQCVQSSPGVILSRRFHAPRLHVRPLLFPPEFFCNILYMCITLDDSSPFGFNIAEALQIKSIVASRGLLQLVNIHPGADEVGLVMLSRAALSLQRASARLALIWRLPQEQARVPNYEGQALNESVVQQVQASGASLVEYAAGMQCGVDFDAVG